MSVLGKVSIKVASRKRKIELGKIERRNQAVQIRQRKRDEVLSKKRMLGGLDSAPFLGNGNWQQLKREILNIFIIVCVLPLHQEFDPTHTLQMLTECDPEIVCNKSTAGVTHLRYFSNKRKF